MSFLKVQSAHLHQVLYPDKLDAPDAGKLTTYIKVRRAGAIGVAKKQDKGERRKKKEEKKKRKKKGGRKRGRRGQ